MVSRNTLLSVCAQWHDQRQPTSLSANCLISKHTVPQRAGFHRGPFDRHIQDYAGDALERFFPARV